MGLVDRPERVGDAAGIGIVERDVLGRGTLERAAEATAPADRRARLHPHPLAERTLEVRRAQERAVDAGRRAFELVAPGDGVVRVEQVTELARHARQLV